MGRNYLMITSFNTIAEIYKLVCEHLSAISDAKLMGVVANVQGIVIVNRLAT